MQAKSNTVKVLQDVQLVIAIAISLIMAYGQVHEISALAMGSSALALLSAKVIVGWIIYKMNGGEKKRAEGEVAKAVITAIVILAVATNMVLSALVISALVSAPLFSKIALGVELTSLALKRCSIRQCGSLKERYSCCL